MEKKETNNGIVIGICPGYRTIRISNGFGIEEKLTDSETKKIIDNIIVPEFKKGDYLQGIRKALLEIINELR